MKSKNRFQFYLDPWRSAPGYYALLRKDTKTGAEDILIVSSFEHCSGLLDELQALNEIVKGFKYVEVFANLGSLRPSFQLNHRPGVVDLSKLNLI